MTPQDIPEIHPVLKALQSEFNELGAAAYLVGGSVRDLIFGGIPTDFDVEVFGINPELLETTIAKVAAVDRVGKSFGVWKLKGLPVDVSLPRTERCTGPQHQDFDTEFDPYLSLDKAASRRDFTINAIYLSLSDGRYVDPFGGIKDLESKTLRHVSDQFSEDALRVLRAMQFVARFELRCARETLELCKSIDGSHLPKERIFGEFEKLLLKGASISGGLNFLKECGWLRYFPEIEALVGCEQDPRWHPEGDVWNHTLLALDAFANRRSGNAKEDLIVGLSVLCHDFGKPTTTFRDATGIRSTRHDIEGVAIAENFLRRITNEREILDRVPLLVREHMNPYTLYKNNAGDSALRRLQLRTGGVEALLRVCQADREGRQSPWVPLAFEEGEWIRDKLERLGLKDSVPEPIFRGRDLIKNGLKPGPEMGKILDALFDLQIEGAFSTYEEGLPILDKLISNENSRT